MYSNFVQLLQSKNISVYKVSKDTGINQATFSDWKTGRSVPRVDKLQKIADYFGVTLDFLINGNSENADKLSGVYLSFAMDAQKSGIDPEDIRLAIEAIKRFKESKLES